MKIGVVIPSYNRAHLISEALTSVFKQTRMPDQVIVVDDGSKDSTELVVAQWNALHGNKLVVQYVWQKNQGPGAARNCGVKLLTSSDFVAFLDSDDLWPISHLAELCSYIDLNPHAVACSRPFMETVFSPHGERLSERLLSKYLLPSLQGPLAIMESMPGTSATMIKRSLFLAINGFDQKLRYAEDRLLFMRISCLGQWGHLGGDPVIYRNQIKSSASDQLSNQPNQNSRVRYAHILDRALAPYIYQKSQWSNGVEIALWKAWHRAGRHFDKKGKYHTAVRYYAKAFCYQRKAKSLGRLLVSFLNGLYKNRI